MHDRAMPAARPAVTAPNYLLFLLYVAYVLNFVDRQLLTLLLADIKRDLSLADWQLGLASGTAFATLYVGASIPVAHLADRSNRVRLLAACIGIWSLMTAACGAATNFIQLILARMGVAIGESGGSPASLSLIGDLFPPERRSSKLGIYFSAAAVGTMLSYVVGGYVNVALGWRWTFLIFAVPGVLLSLLLVTTAREPLRGIQDPEAAGNAKLPLAEVVRFLFRIPLFRRLCLGFVGANLALYTLLTWAPSVALRVYHLDTGTVGLVMGVLGGGVSAGSMIGTGYLSDHLNRRSEAAPLKLVTWAMVLLGLLLPICLLSPNFALFAVAFSLCYAIGASYSPPALAAAHRAVPPHMRAMSSAILFMLGTLAGLGIGPPIVGALSDLMQPGYGEDSLRYAMLILSPVALATAIAFASAAKELGRQRDLLR